MDPTKRFTARADAYALARPSYPIETLDILRDDYGLGEQSVVADVGSGTGIFTRLLLKSGAAIVNAVEPNEDMRKEAERSVVGTPDAARFRSINGSAEATTLDDASIDLVTAAQAFHWFDLARFTSELRRILHPLRGRCALIWNDRDFDGTAFLKEYESILVTHCPGYKELQGKANTPEKFDALFGTGKWSRRTCENEQQLDRDGLISRVMSSSYAPRAHSEASTTLADALTRAFDQHASTNGTVTITYTTVVIGR